MAENSQQKEQTRSGTRAAMLAMLAIATLIIVGSLFWIASPFKDLPVAATGPANESTQLTGRNNIPAQGDAQSGIAKNDPAGLEDPSGGRARNIKQSSEPVQLTPADRSRVREIILKQGTEPLQRIDFELMIGAAVPRKTEARDLPPEIPEIMKGYWGDQYVLVQDKLVIVDKNSRRVAAIISGTAQ
jgi:hypothetical protein